MIEIDGLCKALSSKKLFTVKEVDALCQIVIANALVTPEGLDTIRQMLLAKCLLTPEEIDVARKAAMADFQRARELEQKFHKGEICACGCAGVTDNDCKCKCHSEEKTCGNPNCKYCVEGLKNDKPTEPIKSTESAGPIEVTESVDKPKESDNERSIILDNREAAITGQGESSISSENLSVS
jgi:hypothetical protein